MNFSASNINQGTNFRPINTINTINNSNSFDFVLRLSTDIDNNGFLDQNDFECMAVRACIIEGKGEFSPAKLAEYQHIMRSLWDEISDLADFDKVNSKHLSINHIALH